MAPSPMARAFIALACVALLATAPLAHVAPVLAGEEPIPAIEMNGPAGSQYFGSEVQELPNGNLVICDLSYDTPSVQNVGAAYLYKKDTLDLISTLTGSKAGDFVCADGVTVLANGNFVVKSSYWDNGSAVDAGAVTFVNGETGLNGVVSPANSLVGSHSQDRVGQVRWQAFASSPDGEIDDSGTYPAVVALDNGNYVVNARHWDNGAMQNAGSSTLGSGVDGVSGAISTSNSLVGESANDMVGARIVLLENGNYVVMTSDWDAPGAINAGAATWVDSDTGIVGTIDATNSLVGSLPYDSVGSNAIALTNGNYVVTSSWHSSPGEMVGAATWANGATGRVGTVSAANSLVGVQDMDGVGRVEALKNGNYVVISPYWDHGATEDAGAVTWGNGATGITGQVTTSNSLHGTSAMDRVGYMGVTVLENGNYVVYSPSWSNGALTSAGAATWADGDTGKVGPVTTANSLYGAAADAQVGQSGNAALSNGNYVVCSPLWDNANPAALDLGAATWGNGASGTVGAVSSANSLVGSKAGDKVCEDQVTALKNGNYVVGSSHWDNGAIVDAGAATWGNGATGSAGAVSVSNSLVGGSANDQVGTVSTFLSGGVDVLTNGNYVVRTSKVDLDGVADVGAATWGDGSTGTNGVVSAENSLVGVHTQDQVGFYYPVLALSNGSYVVRSPHLDDDGKVSVGAITWAAADGSTVGPIDESNSLVGTTAEDYLGTGPEIVLPNGAFYLASPGWLNPDTSVAALPQAPQGDSYRTGAVTFGNGVEPLVGTITTANSIIGETDTSGLSLHLRYEPGWSAVIVSFVDDSRVVLSPVETGDSTYLPLVSGQE